MRITLDTNQLVKALIRPPQLATFIMAWESRRFTVICSPALLYEYELVLAYPDIAQLIYPELLRAFHSHLRHDLELVDLPEIALSAVTRMTTKLLPLPFMGWLTTW